MEQTVTESYKQCYVYNDSHIDACFEMEKGEMNMEKNTKHAAQNTDRQTGRVGNIHTRHRLIGTGKQTRNVREGDRGYYW